MGANLNKRIQSGTRLAAVLGEATSHINGRVKASAAAVRGVAQLLKRRPKDLSGAAIRTAALEAAEPVAVTQAGSLNVLLVSPLFPMTYWGFQHGLKLIGKKATLPPLGLITLAALLPASWRLRLIDLNVRRLDAEGRLRGPSNGDPFNRPNFVPAMEETALMRGYMDFMQWLYSPDAYYARCEAFLKRCGRSPGKRVSTNGEVSALLNTVWHVGILSPHRLHFWRLMAKASVHGRSKMRQAVAHVVQGEHLIRYTREQVIPRFQNTLREIQCDAASRLEPHFVGGAK